ncbi:(2Fe-2S)-binding protein [Actinoplanes sp. NPDC051851]|uniref:(2Fe-2S)-binding protein n=1 Tax=Actinoplanes sp. NPDC051851 TaxID=3154753 RepID=UPI0034495433
MDALERFGPYFVWEPYDGDPSWRPLTDLLDPVVVAERVEHSRSVLAGMSGLTRDEIGERPVASITFLGLASRLLSPLLGALVTGGALPPVTVERLWWRPVPGGPLPMAYAESGLDLCAELPIVDLVGPILTVFQERYRLSPQVLWGNVASALGGASGMIARAAPEHAARAAGIVDAALHAGPLRGMADLTRPDPGREQWVLRRRNCCLYYRIPGGGTCGDCVLNQRSR